MLSVKCISRLSSDSESKSDHISLSLMHLQPTLIYSKNAFPPEANLLLIQKAGQKDPLSFYNLKSTMFRLYKTQPRLRLKQVFSIHGYTC